MNTNNTNNTHDTYIPKCVLVTGGLGFIGSNFLNHMVPKYPSIKFICLDKLDYCASILNITVSENPNYIFVKGDISSIDLIGYLLKTHNVDSVIHFAALSDVDRSFNGSLEYTMSNVYGTHCLLEATRQHDIKRFILVSTDEVMGPLESGGNENSLLLPTNPYSSSKACTEMIARSYQMSFKMPIIITRGNNVYGCRQFPEKVIPKFIMNLLNNEKCPLHGGGLTSRSFLHVMDVARAFELILLKGEVGKIYGIGTNQEYTIKEIADKIRQVISPQFILEEVTTNSLDRPFNDQRYSVDSTKLRELGWEEEIKFDDALPEIINWYKKYGKTQWVR